MTEHDVSEEILEEVRTYYNNIKDIVLSPGNRNPYGREFAKMSEEAQDYVNALEMEQ